MRTLWAVSDLHVRAPGNWELFDKHVRPQNPTDWLIVAGDVAEDLDTVIEVLQECTRRFDTVIFTPGNHELYSREADELKGRDKYDVLISLCRELGVVTPEDTYQSFAGRTIVPMFTLYDHTWRDPELTRDEALAGAQERGIVLTDSVAIEPYEDVRLWCRDRLAYTLKRLAVVDEPTILVNHWPLVRQAIDQLKYPDIGLWSGTRHTQTWPERYKAEAVIYGHLHIPTQISVEGVTHTEVSLGYPREWQATLPLRLSKKAWPYPVLVDEEVK
ncbi:metallophosphoesterase family protein [Corynebacterium auriscanis]|uniref:metallophosphoesterase family protein n=1 Tax=Corynebacterium auriscanis TaxID=99807 RepID=UPI0022466305|nr:metallophosphoesterase [Corynebacterium auriscanis]MCX2163016.1 metallophosphoesterase [Corynebacterium auriscanis]